MRAVWSIGRGQLRSRRAATVALMVLVGLGGGVVVAAAAGASRTDSAMARFVSYSRPEDLIAVVNGAQGDPSDATVIAKATAVRSKVIALPQVAEVGRAPYIFFSTNRQGSDIGVNAFAAADTRMFRTIERPRLLDGRLPSPKRADEAVVDDVTAAAQHVRVGSRVRLWAFTADQQGSPETTIFAKYPAPKGRVYTFRVVGVIRVPSTVDAPPAAAVRDAAYGGVGSMELTPAFLARYAADQGTSVESLPGMEIFRVRLRRGPNGAPAFQHAVAGIVSPGDGQIHVGSDAADTATTTAGAIHLESLALVLFAVLAGLAALLVLGQALSRQVAADATDHPTLAALGMSRRELTMVLLIRVGAIAVGGAVVAVAVAVALSPLTPIGLARRAEIDPGVSVDVMALALGFVAVAGLTLASGLVSAWRAGRRVGTDAGRARTQSSALRGTVVGLGPAAAVSISMSLEPRRALRIRAALLAAVVAVAGVVAAASFGISLRHLVDTPREQGWNWDVFVGNPNAAQAFGDDPIAPSLQAEMSRRLSDNRFVGAFTAVALTDGTVDGHPTGLAAIEPIKGSLRTVTVAGRSPRAADEIALGADVLGAVHKRIGQTIALRVGEHRTAVRIVGESLQPTAGNLSTRLSGGAVITLAGLDRLQPNTAAFQFAVRYRPGVDRGAARRSLLTSFGRELLHAYPGGEVGNLARVDSLPYVLAGLLVVLAVGGLGLTLLGSVRAHRRDLAVLQAMGFVRHQVMATVAWQATALAVAAVIVGVPAGVALGRWTWRLVADNVGSVSPSVVPVAFVLLVVPAAFIVANVLASGPAWTAGRIRPSEALRVE